MARARGSSSSMALAFETIYGLIPVSGFKKVPFVSSALGEQQDLIKPNILGLGRDPQTPSRDVINNDGDLVVPIDLRNFGIFLKLLLGAPTTTQGVAATGSIAFSAQPAATSKITINGTDFTFVSASPGATDVLIGATLKATVANAVRALNASADVGVAAATYSTDDDGTTIYITHDTIGTAGNSFTLVAGGTPSPNATVSDATLAGGATTGAYNHVFVSGASTLPSAAIEVGFPEVPSYGVNYGAVADKLAIQMQRSGLLDATVSMICQGEKVFSSSQAGTPSEAALKPFTQFTGAVLRAGVPVADVVNANFTYANNFDKVEVIRRDGRIGGADPGEIEITGQMVVRFGDDDLTSLARAGDPIDLLYGWKIADGEELRFALHDVYLSNPKRPAEGAGGVQATIDWRGAKNATIGRAMTVTLINDVASY